MLPNRMYACGQCATSLCLKCASKLLYDGAKPPPDSTPATDRCIDCRRGQAWGAGEMPHEVGRAREAQAAAEEVLLARAILRDGGAAGDAPPSTQKLVSRLCHAIFDGSLSGVRKWLAAGADPNGVFMPGKRREAEPMRRIKPAFYAGYTPLTMACSGERVSIVALLLTQPRIDVNKPTAEGLPPLYFAVQERTPPTIASILLERPDVNAVPDLPEPLLVLAVRQQAAAAVVEALLSHPAVEPDQVGHDGETALAKACAVYRSRPDSRRIVVSLMAHGACKDVHALLSRHGQDSSQPDWQVAALRAGAEAHRRVQDWLAGQHLDSSRASVQLAVAASLRDDEMY